MDESRKRVIGIMASILAARKLANYDGGKRVSATVSAIADAVRWAEEIISGRLTAAGPRSERQCDQLGFSASLVGWSTRNRRLEMDGVRSERAF